MDIAQLLLSALAALVALTIHEFAHGYVAYKLGDDTAKSLGRLSLNPIKHLDLFGALCKAGSDKSEKLQKPASRLCVDGMRRPYNKYRCRIFRGVPLSIMLIQP